MALDNLADYFPDWKEREALAEDMIPLIGGLYRKNVVTYCYGRALYNQSVTQIMKIHRYVRQVAQNELSEFESHPILAEMAKLDLGPSHIDVGKLATKFMEESESEGIGLAEFIRKECSEVVGVDALPLSEPQDVVLFGFGRIGRLLARLLIEKTGSGQQLRLRAIVVRKGGHDDITKRASLLRRDSIHGSFQGTLRVDEENSCIIANGNVVRVLYANSPDELNYENFEINNAIIIDNTGAWRDEEGLSKHLACRGVSKVVLTAPGKGNIKNMHGEVIGVHDGVINYTIGQRKGIKVSDKEPLYVIKINSDKNEILVGPKAELGKKQISLKQINLLTDSKHLNNNIYVKVRSTGDLLEANIDLKENKTALVNLKIPEDGVSPGQACVFYSKDKFGHKVLGGGWIAN